MKPHISEYTAQEIATLSSRLEKQLGPEYISSRPGPAGQKVHYLSADKCISLANEVFGFNGWSSGIQNIQIDFVDENQHTGAVTLGLSVIVRVTLRDGTFHEDVGYGQVKNCRGKAEAFEKAKKEGTTDALKRSLRNFGNLLGNCIYDKEYVSKVTKLKVAPVCIPSSLFTGALYLTRVGQMGCSESPSASRFRSNQKGSRAKALKQDIRRCLFKTWIPSRCRGLFD